MVGEQLRDRDAAKVRGESGRELREDVTERRVPGECAPLDEGRQDDGGHGLRVGAEMPSIIDRCGDVGAGFTCARDADRDDTTTGHHRRTQGRDAMLLSYRLDQFHDVVVRRLGLRYRLTQPRWRSQRRRRMRAIG